MDTNTSSSNTEHMEPGFKALAVAFLALLSLSILVLKVSDVRPYIYYVIVAAMAVVILLEIVAFRQHSKSSLVILPQIMLLGVSVIWSMTLKYYYYVGRTDVMGHALYAQSLLDTGHVTAVFDMYQAFPLWHIFTVAIALASGLNVGMNEIMYLACGLIFLVMPAAVYLLSCKLCASRRIGLLAALILALNTDLLIIGMYSIARSAASFLLVVLLIVLLMGQTAQKKDSVRMLALALFLTLAILMIHTVSIIFVLALLAAVYVLQKVLARGTTIVSGRYLVLGILMTIAYWVVFAGNLVDVLGVRVVEPVPPIAIPSAVYSPVSAVSELFNYAQYVPYLLLAILGVLIVLRSSRFTREMKLFSVIALAVIPLSFPGPLLLVNQLYDNLSIDRFNEYTFIFMGIIAAAGLAMLFTRKSRFLKVACLSIFMIWIVLSVSNDFVASDNPLVKRDFYTSYMTQSEITGIERIAGITQASAGYTLTDFVAGRYLEFSPYHLNDPSAPLTGGIYAPDNQFIVHNSSDIVLIRADEIEKRPLKMMLLDKPTFTTNGERTALTYFEKDSGAFDNLGDMNQVYDSSAVRGYN